VTALVSLALLSSLSLAATPASRVALKAELVRQHGAGQSQRISRGIDQVAALWRKQDGDLAEFARGAFIADPAVLAQTFDRFQANFEALDGRLNELTRDLRRPTDLDLGPLLPIDPSFSGYDPAAHLYEDLFSNKLGFVALLNFPLTTLEQRLAKGKQYSRREWAEMRLTGRFAQRIPAQVKQQQATAAAAAELYIAEYNLWMHHVLSEKGERLFPKGLRLISHWNLRDELRANYADPRALDKQRTLVRLMERIVAQQIPNAVIDNPRLDWNPFSGEVTVAPEGEVEQNAPKKEGRADPRPEPDTRYARLKANFAAARQADPYAPVAPTAIARAFEQGAEMPEARVKALLLEVLSSPLVAQVAAEVQRGLGRPLEPQDLWYNGFVPRGKIPEIELDALTRKRYPTAEAFAKDIPRILQGLGFSPERAGYLAAHIVVDPSRGAGHAMQAARRGDFPHLRTRVEKEGMSYKGYNIAVHELGHNVEQVFSLYDVDHTLLAGVPNTAFTEALAFVFQGHDLELLGLAKPDPETARQKVLNDFWATWEISGVALLDLNVWHWLYQHPNATPAELRQATLKLSKELWNQFYAPVLAARTPPCLASTHTW
jgi:hypothetical protein